MSKPIIAYEFCNLYPAGEKHNEGDIAVPRKSFDNLWDFILENTNSDLDAIMSVHTRGGNKFIKTNRYVGTIQTSDGLTIEILPKIYDHSDSKSVKDEIICRKVFLKMLASVQEEKAKSFQTVNLETKDNFPILEYYIANYLNEIEKLLLSGIKKNYSYLEENKEFLKGKLLINKQIKKNSLDKTKFYVRYSKYVDDIPQNRILISTLNKLSKSVRNFNNKAHIYKLQNILSDIPESKNIISDFQVALNSNRTFSAYKTLMEWSLQFLNQKGFTTFSGNHFNQALLFPAERLFESYIAMLFRKHARDFVTSAQHSKYYLIDKHNDKGFFRLRPDLFLQSDNSDKISEPYKCILIDTKWKVINSKLIDKNYLIDIKDMYQLFAYGEKYGQHIESEKQIEVNPKLVLLYPCTKDFNNPLPEFDYEELKKNSGLKLFVIPFDLSEPDPRPQIQKILNIVQNEKEFKPDENFNYWL